MLHSMMLSGGKGGIKGASSKANSRTSFGQKGGGINFGDRGIDEKYILIGVVVLVVGYVVVSLKG